MATGRPSAVCSSFVGSTPSSVKIVAARSAGVTGLSAGLSPTRSLDADDLPAANAAAGQRHAEYSRPVVAAAGRVHLRRAAKLAHRDHQRLIEQTAIGQVGDQRGEREIERRDQADADLCTRVPLLEPQYQVAVRVPAGIVDGDERRRRARPAAGRADNSGRWSAGRTRARVAGFSSDRSKACLASGEVTSRYACSNAGSASVVSLLEPIELFDELAAAIHAAGRTPGKKSRSRTRKSGFAGSLPTANGCRAVPRNPAPIDCRGVRDRGVGRQRVPAAADLRDTTDPRLGYCKHRRRLVAGEQVMVGQSMLAERRRDRADNRDLVGELRGVRQKFADLDARGLWS